MRTPLPAYLSQKPRDKTIFPLDTSVLRSVATPSAALAGIDKPVRPTEALAPTVFNFAFGSNLNPEKRSSRGVNGTGIVSRHCYPAVVKGFRLAFNLPMFPPVEPGMAALARAREGEDDSCHGLLLELSNEEYQKLWASEGGMEMYVSVWVSVFVSVSVRVCACARECVRACVCGVAIGSILT
jgi:hypothetical protein